MQERLQNRVPPTLPAVVATERRGNVLVEEIRWPAQAGLPIVTATRVRPSGAGPFAAVLWVHWLGEAQTTNRTEFLPEALELANDGVVSLLVDALWSAPGWYQERLPEGDFEAFLGQAEALMSAVSVLCAEPGVDATRVGVVGHDYGAMHAVLAGSVEHRPAAWVLVAPTPHFSDWAFFGPKPKDRAVYLAQLVQLDPVAFIGQLPGAVLLQFANADEYVSPDAAAELARAAPSLRTVKVYATDHAVAVPAAKADRRAFLLEALHPVAQPVEPNPRSG